MSSLICSGLSIFGRNLDFCRDDSEVRVEERMPGIEEQPPSKPASEDSSWIRFLLWGGRTDGGIGCPSSGIVDDDTADDDVVDDDVTGDDDITVVDDDSGDDDTTPCIDEDGDGYCVEDGDCDDANAEINPGAAEIVCDGIDQDCNGSDFVDEVPPTLISYDLYNPVEAIEEEDITLTVQAVDDTLQAVTLHYMFTTTGAWQSVAMEDLDGDDFYEYTIPGAEVVLGALEYYFAAEDVCLNTVFDPEAAPGEVYTTQIVCLDDDADGFCAEDDCDDNDDTVYPGAEEIAWDGIDQDCDGQDLECPYYVDINNVSGIEDGSLAYPFNTIGEAHGQIDPAECQEVLVFPGTYGRFTISQKDITVRSTDGPVLTIVDGQGTDVTVQISNCAAVLDGFTITNGYSSGSGGGVQVNTSIADPDMPIIQHNILYGNNSDYGGGGIAVVGSWDQWSGAIIRNNLIVGNTSGIYPAGISVGNISNGLVDIVVENNTVVGNWPGGIFFDHQGDVTAQNNIVAFNDIGLWDYYSFGGPVAQYNCVYGNSYADYVAYSQPDPTDINEDPLFVAFTDDSDWTNDDFHLQMGSPCIDVGNPDAAYDDVDGTPNDMGAYGGPYGDW